MDVKQPATDRVKSAIGRNLVLMDVRLVVAAMNGKSLFATKLILLLKETGWVEVFSGWAEGRKAVIHGCFIAEGKWTPRPSSCSGVYGGAV